MATTIYYGNARIYNAVTREWNEEVIYDDSNTDVIGTKFKFRFTGYIHAQSTAGLAPTNFKKIDTFPTNLVDAYRDAHLQLNEPRKQLRIVVGVNELVSPPVSGREIFRCEPPDDGKRSNVDRDIENGPKPRGLNIVKVVNDQILHVEWSIECMKLLCDTQAGPNEILNNRWSLSEELDTNWFMTKTIRGKLRLSASNYSPGHAFRTPITPGLEMGFRRERVQYALSENGLQIEYEITDRQIHDAAPWPATKLNGSYTSSTNDGESFISSCRVRLEGPPHAAKQYLITQALNVCEQRIQYAQKRIQGKVIPEACSITENLGDDNSVEVSITVRELPGNNGEFLTRLRAEVLGKPIQIPPLEGNAYVGTFSRQPEVYGYDPFGASRAPAYLFLQHCYLQSPCQGEHDIRGFPQTPSASKDGQQQHTTIIQPQPTGFLEARAVSNTSLWSETALAGNMYTFSRAESRYVVKRWRAQLPVAATVNEQASSNDDTCVFIDLAPGIAVRELVVESERLNAWPEVPYPEDSYTDGSIRGKLLDYETIALPIKPTGDGSGKLYRLRTKYRWGLNRLPRPDEKIRVGMLPITGLSQDANAVPGTQVYQRRLGP